MKVDRDRIVCIATRKGLEGPVIESLLGTRFSAPVQTGPEAHPMDTGSFPGLEPSGHDGDNPPLSSAEVKERVELLHSPPPWVFVACSRTNFPFFTLDMKIKQTNTRVGTLIVATIYLQLIRNRYMFRSFTVLQCSHQHCVQPVASDVEVVGYL